MSPVTTVFAALTGVYGGYFGAGSGVMMMAVLGFGTDLEFRIVNALKTLAVVASNVVASVIFLFVAELDWTAVLLLAGGSVVGGYVGARIGNYLPPNLLRVLIVITGDRGRDLPVLTTGQVVSHRNSRADDQRSARGEGGQDGIGRSAAEAGSPRTITSSIPSLS